MAGACVGCGSTEKIEIHHVKKIANLNPKLNNFDKLMSILNRKQIPVCAACHADIHRGLYDSKSLRKRTK